MINQLSKTVFLLLAMTMAFFASASNEGVSQGPYQVVEGITEDLLGLIESYEGRFEEEEAAFFADLDEVLDGAVDFRFIAKNVMGPYRKVATPEQFAHFEQVFRADLVETYGRGLFSYGNEQIVLLPLAEDLAGKRRVTIFQELHSGDKRYPINYSMGLNRQGEWKVTNLVINGINLGKTFRNQFLQRAKEYDGDIEKVVKSWTASLQV